MDPGLAGLDPCWSQTHYVGFVMARLICTPLNSLCNVCQSGGGSSIRFAVTLVSNQNAVYNLPRIGFL
jgi:hypothetical protein